MLNYDYDLSNLSDREIELVQELERRHKSVLSSTTEKAVYFRAIRAIVEVGIDEWTFNFIWLLLHYKDEPTNVKEDVQYTLILGDVLRHEIERKEVE